MKGKSLWKNVYASVVPYSDPRPTTGLVVRPMLEFYLEAEGYTVREVFSQELVDNNPHLHAFIFQKLTERIQQSMANSRWI